MVTVVFPVIFWLFIALALYKKGQTWREAFLSAAVLWGVVLIGATEGLSFWRSLTFTTVAIFWGSAALISIIIFLKAGGDASGPSTISIPLIFEVLIGAVAVIAAITGFIAVIAPPNNWDSMTYHMSRVVHWIQNQGVQHYPTNIIRQIELNSWAEFAIMHFQILSGYDYLANLVQWFSMLGCVIGVSLIAKQLGANLRGQVYASVIVATVPMGILQASSTQNDYVVSFWLVCFVHFGLLFRSISRWPDMILSALSLGLALLTKGTAYIYAFPFIVWFFISGVRSLHWKIVPILSIAALVVLTLNIGHYKRNFDLFHNPLSSGETSYSNDRLSVPVFVSNVVRNLALHIGTRWLSVNKSMEAGIYALHRMIGADANDCATTFPGATFEIPRMNFHEDSAGNPLHVLLLSTVMALLLFNRRFRQAPYLMEYFCSILAASLLFCLLLRWQPWASRLHLPLFVLFASLAGTVVGMSDRKRIGETAMIVLVLAAVPASIKNVSRPLFGQASIVDSRRLDMYFSNRPWLKESYFESIAAVNEQKCDTIALHIGADDWEYPIWVIAKEISGRMPRIEHIQLSNLSAKIQLIDFEPCAILETDNDKKLNVKFIK